MTKPFWPLAVNTWGEAERAAAHRVIDSGNLTMGEEVAAFEHEFAAYVGSRFAVMVNSGSSANLLAVAAVCTAQKWTLKHGYEYNAVVPAIAWATTYAPLHQHGFSLRVADVNPATLNSEVAQMEACVDPSTQVLVAVSILGNPAPLVELRALADREGIVMIEDNCESLGATVNGKYCGTLGHIGTFSFFFSHHLSTGEGGMLVTDDRELYEIALCLRAHGWTRQLPEDAQLRSRPEIRGDYQFVVPGYNLRPTELAAAVGRVQLRRLDYMNTVRRNNWTAFCNHFDTADERWRVQTVGDSAVPFGFTLVFNNQKLRTFAAQQLRAAGIEYRMITGGCFSEHPAEKYYHWSLAGTLKNARHAHHCGLFVGNHPFDLREQIARMAEVLI